MQKETTDKIKKKNDSTVTEDRTTNKTEKIEKEKEKEKKATIVTIKEAIQADEVKLGSQILHGVKLVESRHK